MGSSGTLISKNYQALERHREGQNLLLLLQNNFCTQILDLLPHKKTADWRNSHGLQSYEQLGEDECEQTASFSTGVVTGSIKEHQLVTGSKQGKGVPELFMQYEVKLLLLPLNHRGC